MYNLSYKAYRTKKLKHIHRMINAAASIWNHCVALQKRYYRLYGKYIHVNKLQKHIGKLRNRNLYWKQLNSQSTQEICQRVDESYKRFFKKIAKCPPKYKKARNFSSIVLKQCGYSLKDNILTLNKIGSFKFHKSREYENIRRISIKRNKLGEIFFILTCDMKLDNYKRLGNANVGIDFGLKTYLTCSDESEIVSPEFFKNNIKILKSANRKLSSKKKGSKNRKKTLMNLQRIHINVTNKRSDFEWKLAHELCKKNKFIAIEDLNMAAMKKLWGRKISDLSFSSFVLKLQQVALKYGTEIQKVGKFYPSSKLCTCGVVNKDLKLSDRVWVCTSCNVEHKRDVLASNNILTEGIRLYRTRSNSSVKEVSLV